ncbi:hypothetical protein CDL15_Pgr012788 [Punica granatum]|uniref:Uncharacterized protein n=1 Tax=Punica granatum TaxID=22663 RepID=A0A218XEC7_PUNGR|nr:hypothetical protein CDL15_Pgr012788 [Punica granatum]PKI73979.1 hypothetical protein CRG98_005596 [Punica granatum]
MLGRLYDSENTHIPYPNPRPDYADPNFVSSEQTSFVVKAEQLTPQPPPQMSGLKYPPWHLESLGLAGPDLRC